MLGDAASLDWRNLLAHTRELESIALDRLGECNIETWDESGMAKFLDRPDTRARKEKPPAQTRATTAQGGRHQSVATVAPRLSPAVATERDHSPDRLSPSPAEGDQSEARAEVGADSPNRASTEPPPVAPPPTKEDQLGMREESPEPSSYPPSSPPSPPLTPAEGGQSEVPEDVPALAPLLSRAIPKRASLEPHTGEKKCQSSGTSEEACTKLKFKLKSPWLAMKHESS